MTSSIEIHIDELVLHGFPPADRNQVASETEHQLARLLAERGIPERLAGRGDTPQLSSGSFDTQVDDLGKQIARAVYEGLST